MAVFQDKEQDLVPSMLEFAATNRRRKEEMMQQAQESQAAGNRAQQQLDLEARRLSDQEAQQNIQNARQAQEDQFKFAELTRRGAMEQYQLNEMKRQALMDTEGLAILTGGDSTFSATAFQVGSQDLDVSMLDKARKSGQLPAGVGFDETGKKYTVNGKVMDASSGKISVPMSVSGNQIFQKFQEANEAVKSAIIAHDPEALRSSLSVVQGLRKAAAPFIRHVEGGALSGNPYMVQAADIMSGGMFSGHQAIRQHLSRRAAAGEGTGAEGVSASGTPLEVLDAWDRESTLLMYGEGVSDMTEYRKIWGRGNGMEAALNSSPSELVASTPETVFWGTPDANTGAITGKGFIRKAVLAPLQGTIGSSLREFGSSGLGQTLSLFRADKVLDGDYGKKGETSRRELLRLAKDRAEQGGYASDVFTDPMQRDSSYMVHDMFGQTHTLTFGELRDLVTKPSPTPLQTRQYEEILPKLVEDYKQATPEQRKKMDLWMSKESGWESFKDQLQRRSVGESRQMTTIAGVLEETKSLANVQKEAKAMFDQVSQRVVRAEETRPGVGPSTEQHMQTWVNEFDDAYRRAAIATSPAQKAVLIAFGQLAREQADKWGKQVSQPALTDEQLSALSPSFRIFRESQPQAAAGPVRAVMPVAEVKPAEIPSSISKKKTLADQKKAADAWLAEVKQGTPDYAARVLALKEFTFASK